MSQPVFGQERTQWEKIPAQVMTIKTEFLRRGWKVAFKKIKHNEMLKQSVTGS